MNDLTEKTITSEIGFSGKLLTVKRDEVLLPNGRRSIRETIQQIPAVGILAITKDDHIVLVKQYRHAIGRTILEIAAGKIDDNEEPIQCAFRELKEETGYMASSMHHLTTFYTSPGSTNGTLHLYEAQGLTKGDISLDSDEFVELVLVTKEEVCAAIENGDICDAKTIIAIHYWQQKGK